MADIGPEFYLKIAERLLKSSDDRQLPVVAAGARALLTWAKLYSQQATTTPASREESLLVEGFTGTTSIRLQSGRVVQIPGLAGLESSYAEWTVPFTNQLEVLDTAGPSPHPLVLKLNGQTYVLAVVTDESTSVGQPGEASAGKIGTEASARCMCPPWFIRGSSEAGTWGWEQENNKGPWHYVDEEGKCPLYSTGTKFIS